MDPVRAALTSVWPLYGLTIRTPRLELRLPTETDMVQLSQLAKAGIHPPGFVPMGDWTYQEPSKLERSVLQRHWHTRAEWKPKNWTLALAVYLDGTPIGCQDLSGKDFGKCRVCTTGSWMGLEHQGHGYGTEMRQAVAYLAFEKLGAASLWSGYWHDNEPSRGVSRKLGYTVICDNVRLRYDPETKEEVADRMYDVRLQPDFWVRPAYRITVTGFDPCRALFGI